MAVTGHHRDEEDVLTIVMRWFVPPRRVVMSRAGPCPGVCRRGGAGCRRLAPVPRLSAAGGPAGGSGGDCAARRGGAARMFPGGHRMVLPECSAGIAHARARF